MFNFIIGVLNNLINGLGIILNAILSILPSSPFKAIDNGVISPYLSGLAWIVPMNQIIAILEAWGVSVGVYYIYIYGCA